MQKRGILPNNLRFLNLTVYITHLGSLCMYMYVQNVYIHRATIKVEITKGGSGGVSKNMQYFFFS